MLQLFVMIHVISLRRGIHHCVQLPPKTESTVISLSGLFLTTDSAFLSHSSFFLGCWGPFMLVCPMIHRLRYELSVDVLTWKQSSMKLLTGTVLLPSDTEATITFILSPFHKGIQKTLYKVKCTVLTYSWEPNATLFY